MPRAVAASTCDLTPCVERCCGRRRGLPQGAREVGDQAGGDAEEREFFCNLNAFMHAMLGFKIDLVN